MIFELLKLKARLHLNGLRRPGTAILGILTVLAGVAFVVGLAVGAGALAALPALTVGRVLVLVGALFDVAAFLVPLAVVRAELLDPRALRGYGFSRWSVGLALLLTTLVGPAAILVPLALLPTVLWTGVAESAALAVAPLIVLQGVLAARIGAALGTTLRHRPVTSAVVRVVVVVVLLAAVALVAAELAPHVGALLPPEMWARSLAVVLALAPLRVPAITDVLAASPLGAWWRVPLDLESGASAGAVMLPGLVVLVGLGLVWAGVVLRAFRATVPIPRARVARIPGWFRHTPSTATGAVTARSLTYWFRDPRYFATLVLIPAVPGIAALAIWISGFPVQIGALFPLPVVVMLLAWGTLHNDVAYDHMAIWTHVVAHVRGVPDRLGRTVPVLAIGVVLIAVGAPVTAWVVGDPLVLPALVGVCAALLLGGVGVSSVASALSPYPATRPGDSAFQQPQVQGSSGSGTQGTTLFLILLFAAPAIAALVLHMIGMPGPWTWIGLAVGLGMGLLVLVGGIRLGATAFERRGPELLAFTMRH